MGFMRPMGPMPADDPASLIDPTIPKPTAAGRDLLVKIEAVSANPIGTKVRRRGDQKEPKILGYDATGVVEAVGAETTLFRPGDAMDERIVGRQPATLTFGDDHGWELLFDRIGIDPNGKDTGKNVLIIDSAGGGGSIAIQLAKRAGLVVTATAARPKNVASGSNFLYVFRGIASSASRLLWL
jgi:NADPH:quinone reductase